VLSGRVESAFLAGTIGSRATGAGVWPPDYLD